MTVSVIFSASQALLDNGSNGVQLAQVILPYSIRNSEDQTKYLGGQMTLFPSDGIKLSDNTEDWEHLALIKIKEMVADAEIYVPEPIVVVPEELPATSVGEPDVEVSEEPSGGLTEVSSAEVPEATVENSASSEVSVANE